MAAGACRHCGYKPVAFDAPICPRCAGDRPNPSRGTRWARIGFWAVFGPTLMLAGLLLVVTRKFEIALGPVFIGFLVAFFVGDTIGYILGRLFGDR